MILHLWFRNPVFYKNTFSYFPNRAFTTNSYILNCLGVGFQENKHSQIYQEGTGKENRRDQNYQQ